MRDVAPFRLLSGERQTAHAFATSGKRQVAHTSANSEKHQIAHTFALTRILANTPYGSRENPGSARLYGYMGTLGGTLFCSSGKSQAEHAFAVSEKNIGSKANIPCRNQAICQQALTTIVIRNSLNASI